METLDNRQPFWAISKICLNNWHYIDRKILTLSEGINFFTGHSGSGKSTVIDAIQIVLYANTDGRGFFNKAAADDSDRTLIEFKPCGPEEKNGNCDTVRLATCEYFTTYESTLNGTTTLHVDDESFGSILLIEGSATIENDGTTLEANKGDSVFIDANSGDVKIQGNCQWIYSRV